MKLALCTDQPRKAGRPLRGRLRLALGALAVAGLIGAAVPRPASAAATNSTTPLQLNLTKLHANETTGEVGNDEPYVVIFSADLSTTKGAALSQRTAVFNMKKGETVNPILQPWATAGGKASIADTDDVLVLAALMENDGSDPDVVRNNVDSRVRSVLTANRNLAHATLVSKLRTEMNAALDEARKASGSNHDERIGGAESVGVTPGNVLDAASGRSVQITLRFTGNSGNYDATFTLSS